MYMYMYSRMPYIQAFPQFWSFARHWLSLRLQQGRHTPWLTDGLWTGGMLAGADVHHLLGSLAVGRTLSAFQSTCVYKCTITQCGEQYNVYACLAEHLEWKDNYGINIYVHIYWNLLNLHTGLETEQNTVLISEVSRLNST